MGKTFAEKILAKKVGKDVQVGEIVIVQPDRVMSHDNTSAIVKTFKKIGPSKIVNPEKVVIVLDHCVPAATDTYAQNHKEVREFVKDQKIKNFFDIQCGVCHQVFSEKGFALPGTVILGSDSHTTMYGALGAFSAGVGRSEMAALYATGELWLMVPPSFKMVLNGKFPVGVYAKDLALYILGKISADGALYMSIEFTGSAVEHMSISERMTLANMGAEMGAKNAYFAPDKITEHYLALRTIAEYEEILPDKDAVYEETLEINLEDIEPQVARPHTVDNVAKVSEVAGKPFQQALIGTCTNGRLDDLSIAADILKGKKIHPDVRMLIFPASQEVFIEAVKKGVITTLSESGAVIMNPGCGPCLGAHEGILAGEEVCLSTANRNFKGRMGCASAEVYLASPATVAASALTGVITDPREVLKEVVLK